MRKIIFSSSFTLAFFVLTMSALAYGHSIGGDDASDILDKIAKYEKKLADLTKKEKSLQNEIEGVNDQIELIQLKIQEVQGVISQKEKELLELSEKITDVSGKITKLSDNISYQTLLLDERIRLRYMSQTLTPVDFVFSNNINGLIQKVQFLKFIEDQDNKLIRQLGDVRVNYQNQKTILEDAKKKVEEVKKSIEVKKNELENYRVSLVVQKRQKDSLLIQTRGDEATYQNLLQQARAELDAIEGAVNSVNFTNGTKVNKGDLIAYMGNSGYPKCSTGSHLHFEVRKSGRIVNSENYLKPKTVYVNDFSSGYKTIGSGKWEWPMTNPEITQRYGRTPWSWRYSGNSHTGVDMVSSDTRIFAPDDGKYVRSYVSCYGSLMNFASIDHGDGVISYYFHIR